MNDLQTARQLLVGDAGILPGGLSLDLDGIGMIIRSNSQALLDGLGHYFRHVVGEVSGPALEVLAIERQVVDSGLNFTDWKREPGKTGRKDAYFDIPQGRLVLKVRTGMLFLQSESERIAAGPCLEYDNQVINFINAQYMNWLQQHGWLICHASGLVWGGGCLGIAGFSGGGKSTLMLRLLEEPGVAFLTNDRLFLKRQAGAVDAVGIPKLPRINPGTIVHNDTLHDLIPQARRDELAALPKDELWDLEEKFDVDVEEVYGAGKLQQRAPCSHFMLLNWSRNSSDPLKVTEVELAERRELLGAVMKSPGPFYQFSNGEFFQDTMELPAENYLDLLADIKVMEVTGGVDFIALEDYCRRMMLQED